MKTGHHEIHQIHENMIPTLSSLVRFVYFVVSKS
jgi:hypothetical protein